MTEQHKIRVGAYLRVSADLSGRAKSVNEQADEYAEDLTDHPDWCEVDRYPDNDRSASRFATKPRPQFDRLVADIETGRIDLVWLWEISRQSRDLAVFVPLRELCRRRGLKWYVHSEQRLYDFARPADVRALTRSAVDAEEESEKTSMRIQRSVRANLRNGRPHSVVPYGYVRRYDPITKEFAGQDPHPLQAPVVVEICTRYAAGESLNSIATDLDRRGVLSRGAAKRAAGKKVRAGLWNPGAVRDVATSPVYAGKRVYEGTQNHADGTPFVQIHDACWPALVDATVHEQCVRRAQQPPDRRWARTSRPTHLLTSIARCAVCGAIIAPANRPGPGGVVGPYYTCKARGCVRIPEPAVDEAVYAVIDAWLAAGNLASLQRADTSGQAATARAEAAAARTEHAQALALAKAGKLSVFAFAELEPELLARIDAADAAATRLVMPGPVAEAEKLLRGKGKARRRFRDLDLGIRRQVLAALFTITLEPTGRRRTFRPEQIVMDPKPLA